MSISTAGTNGSGALLCSAQWGFPNQGNIRGAKRAASSLQPVWWWLTRPRQGQKQQWPSPNLPSPIKESLRDPHQSGNGMAVGAGYTGRAQKHSKHCKEIVASTGQKATASLSSAPSITDAAAHCASGETCSQESAAGCAVRKGGVSTPLGKCTQVEELLWLLTDRERERDT